MDFNSIGYYPLSYRYPNEQNRDYLGYLDPLNRYETGYLNSLRRINDTSLSTNSILNFNYRDTFNPYYSNNQPNLYRNYPLFNSNSPSYLSSYLTTLKAENNKNSLSRPNYDDYLSNNLNLELEPLNLNDELEDSRRNPGKTNSKNLKQNDEFGKNIKDFKFNEYNPNQDFRLDNSSSLNNRNNDNKSKFTDYNDALISKRDRFEGNENSIKSNQYVKETNFYVNNEGRLTKMNSPIVVKNSNDLDDYVSLPIQNQNGK